MRWTLSRFAESLRREGIAVSPAELVDAATALRTIDVADREALRTTLRAVLVKRRGDAEPFERAFARFFAPPARVSGSAAKRRRRVRLGGGDAGARRAGGSGEGAAGARQERRRLAATIARALVSRRGAAEQRRPAAPGHKKEEPRKGRASTRGSARPPTSRQSPASPPPPAPPQRPALPRRPESPRRGIAGPAAVVRKPFRSRWSRAEEAELARELARVLARLRLRRTRRKRRARHGGLWVQRMIRANLGHDGVPLRLIRRAPARREPRLLLLVDVSHSVRRAAAAFLTIVAALARAFRDVRAFAFVDQPVDLTAALPRLARLGGSADRLAALVGEHPQLDDRLPSDYGRTLYRLLDQARQRRGTVALILGDARTNRFDAMPWALESLRERVRRIVWLVPESRAEWDRGDSVISLYAPHCDLVHEAADLEALLRLLGRSVR